MAILSTSELYQQAELSYIRGTYYVALTQTATGYTSSVLYSNIVADEVTAGTAGYARLSFTYSATDLLAYSSGQPLIQKTAQFIHDNSTDIMEFNHVAILREVNSAYTVVAVDSVGADVKLTSGNTATIRINLLHGRP